MRDALKISIPVESVVIRAQDETGILVQSTMFLSLLQAHGYGSPVGSGPTSPDRFRVHISILHMSSYTGVYFVSGWLDEGYVHLEKDPDQLRVEPDRRAAVAATKNKR